MVNLPSRFLQPLTPGGLLSPSVGDELTANEESVVQAIAAGTYFVENEVPSGTIDGSNVTFTLAGNPNPDASLELKMNGQYLKAGGEDFTLSGTSITMVNAPPTGSLLLASYRVSPV